MAELLGEGVAVAEDEAGATWKMEFSATSSTHRSEGESLRSVRVFRSGSKAMAEGSMLGDAAATAPLPFAGCFCFSRLTVGANSSCSVDSVSALHSSSMSACSTCSAAVACARAASFAVCAALNSIER